MLDLTLRKILDCLSEDVFVSMDVLCKQTHRSEKTIRKLLSELGGMLEENGANLVKKYGKGIQIVVFDRTAYQKFLSDGEQVFSCNTSEERIRYILYVLLFRNEFIKIEDLCEKLFASRKTISTDLRQIDEYLDGYCLILERKPYHGLLITGQELRFRQCMLEYLMGLQREGDWIRSQCFADEDVIRQCVMDKLNQYGYLLYESELRTLILQIQIALYRLQNGHGMTIEEMDYNSGLKEIDIDTANVCARSLQGINPAYVFDIPEIKYLAILISGKKRQQASYPDNIVIDMEINQLVNDMLASVIKVFNVDLYEDFELQTILRKHMFALRIRLQYHMQLKNPMLKEIKETYSFPYAMAAQACTILAEYFHTIVSEDEIGYIAMCIALSIERKKKRPIAETLCSFVNLAPEVQSCSSTALKKLSRTILTALKCVTYIHCRTKICRRSTIFFRPFPFSSMYRYPSIRCNTFSIAAVRDGLKSCSKTAMRRVSCDTSEKSWFSLTYRVRRKKKCCTSCVRGSPKRQMSLICLRNMSCGGNRSCRPILETAWPFLTLTHRSRRKPLSASPC